MSAIALDAHSVHAFWRDYTNPMVYKILVFLEASEHWTLDDAQGVPEALQALADALSKFDKKELVNLDEIIQVLVYLKHTKMLRILDHLNKAHPGSVSALFAYSEEASKTPNDMPGLLLRRHVVFDRLVVLTRVFAMDRLKLVTSILEREES
jgi:intracellular multiplication protein IcmW